MEDHIGTTDAARIVEVNSSTLRRACQRGEVSGAILKGGSWFAPKQSWIDWKANPLYHKTGKKVQRGS
jgi:hypothetical protein